ncbi:MAG: hypothetical protein K8H89_13650 [Flavobacteriales bacterium]|jgi:hypothetical protein|nr:hypothetical protein [Flavobacteriales bacterium]
MTIRTLIALAGVALALPTFAQSPQAFNYQGVARDAAGDAVVNTTIGVQFLLHQTTAVGTVVYAETHAPTTNEHGLFSVEVGNGTPGTGTFATLDWSAGPYFLEVGLDPAGGSSYTSVGTQQLLSVPYALHAGSVDMADDGDWVQSGDTLHSDGKRVGIGTAAPSTDLDVEGSFQLKDGTQADKKILTSDAEGNASWETLNGASIFGAGNLPPANSGDISCLNEVMTVSTGDAPYAVAVSGSYAYVLNRDDDNMTVFDLSDPASPVEGMTVSTGDGPLTVAIFNTHAYVVNQFSDNMTVFDLSDPASPIEGVTVQTGNSPVSVAVSDSHAYVVNFGESTMTVYDLSDPASPVEGMTVSTEGYTPTDVAVSGSHVYVVNFNSDNMTIFDLSDPASPSLVGTVSTGVSSPLAVAVSGSHAYVVNSFSGDMTVFDLSDPASPSPVGVPVPTGDTPYAMTVFGSHAYVLNAGSDNMTVFDLSDPASPDSVTTIQAGNYPISVALSGSHAYVVNLYSDDMTVFELFCPNPPGQVVYDPVSGEFSTSEGWIQAGDTLYTLDKKVGIGTRDPEAVQSGTDLAIVDDAGEHARLVLKSGATKGLMDARSTPGAERIQLGSISAHPISFFTTGTLRMTLDTTGSLGIGTAYPAYPLDIRSDGQGFGQHSLDSTIALGTYVDNTYGAFFQTHTAHPLHFATNNGNAQMTLLQSGNFGIGTSDPASRMHTKVNASTTATLLQRTGLFLDNGSQTGTFPNNPNEVGLVFGENGVAKQAILGATYANDHLRFYTGSNFTTSRMAINATGDVGIGTASPGAKLEVNGYTKLGSDAPAIKQKVLTGNFPSAPSTFVNIAHGLDPAKILAVDITVQLFSTIWAGDKNPPASDFTYSYGTSSVTIVSGASTSSSTHGNPLRVLITYME